MCFRRCLVLVLALLAVTVAACGDGDRPTRVAAGGEPGAATSTTVGSGAGPAAAGAPSTTTSTTAPVPPGSVSADSPVNGLRADQLQAVLTAPAGGARRSASGPTVDQVTLSDGARVWRVRVPGSFTARSARVAVSVGPRRVGEAVLAPDLQSITAVTTDGRGLTAGQVVSYQWEGGPATAAGTLVAAR